MTHQGDQAQSSFVSCFCFQDIYGRTDTMYENNEYLFD